MISDNISSKRIVDSWNDCFLSRKSAPLIDKSFKSKLFLTFNADIISNDCKEQMIKQNKLVFLFKMNFGQGKVNMLHHCQEIGGKLWMQEEYFAAIQGI